MRFEWQHRGSPHIHGLAWLPGAPNIQNVFATDNIEEQQKAIHYIDSLVTTINPGILPDGSDFDSAPLPQTTPHICNVSYLEVSDYQEDLVKLVATCERHTKCSTSYCLRTKNGSQVCRFHQ